MPRKLDLPSGEMRAEAKQRMLREGVWREFVKVRDKFRGEGMSLDEAWREAMRRFMPPDRKEAEAKAGPAPPPVNAPVKKKKVVKKTKHTSDRVPGFVFEDNSCPAHVVVEWVAKHLSIEDVYAEQAPSSEAWGLLNWAKRQPSNEQEFWKNIYPKLMPSRQQLEQALRFTDDGKSQIELIDRVLAASIRAKERADVGLEESS